MMLKTLLVVAATILLSPLAFAGHTEVLKNYPNAKSADIAVLAKARADCLRDAVDDKIAGDIRVGKIRDFGNVREAEMCGKDIFDAYNKHREKPTKATKPSKAKKVKERLF